MELTKAQKHMIRWLKISGCTEEETIGIFQLMDTPEKRDELMMYMADNRHLTSQDILKKALEITLREKQSPVP